MATLEKAYLQPLTPSGDAKPSGAPIPVQFNPTSMRLTMANSTTGAKTTGQQVKQYNGTSSTTLALDLVFDTADELGSGADAADVRDRTKQVAQFILTGSQRKTKFAPPRVRFHWGAFQLDGVMTAFTEDIDLFSAAGVPLRAKVSISIQEQDSRLELLEGGKGALDAGGATKPDAPAAGAPGSNGAGSKDRSGIALAGESAAGFAARMGLDPGAWRGLAAGLDSTVSLQAGAEIDFSSSLSLSAGVGLSGGVEAGAGVSLGASLGLAGGASLGIGGGATAGVAGGVGVGGSNATGFALSAAGGVSAAAQAVQTVQAASAAADARAAFQAPPASGTASGGGATNGGPSVRPAGAGPASRAGSTVGEGSLPSATAAAAASVGASSTTGPDQPRPRLRDTDLPSASRQAATPPAPPPPTADRRATTFGYGVPLRPQVHGAAQEAPAGGSWIRIGHRVPSWTAPETRDPTARPWEALPGLHEPRSAADAEQRRRAADRLCTCRGGSGVACSRHGGLR